MNIYQIITKFIVENINLYCRIKMISVRYSHMHCVNKMLIFLTSLCLQMQICLASQEDVNTQKASITTTTATNEPNGLVKFFRNYIFSEKNQIFGDNKYGIFFTYGVSVKHDRVNDIHETFEDYYRNSELEKDQNIQDNFTWSNRYRAVGVTSIHYAVPDRLMHINGRLSLGFFNWHGLNSEYSKRFGAIGLEFIQEFIFGSPMIYFTMGVGPAYVFEIEGYNRHVNMASQFFFAIVANVGHRFDNGAVIEIGWKHYSNGRLRVPNIGLDNITMTIGYTF